MVPSNTATWKSQIPLSIARHPTLGLPPPVPLPLPEVDDDPFDDVLEDIFSVEREGGEEGMGKRRRGEEEGRAVTRVGLGKVLQCDGETPR